MTESAGLIPVERMRRKANWKACYQCPHNGKVHGDYKGSPCATCPGPSETINNHGQNHVSLDLVEDFIESAGGISHEGEQGHTPAAFLQDPGMPGDHGTATDDTFAQLPADVCQALRTFFGEWLRMPSTMREAVAVRISDPEVSYHVIAKRIGVTMQAVANSLKLASGNQCRALACLTLTKNKPRQVRGNLNITAFRTLVMGIAGERCPIRKTELIDLVSKATGSRSQSETVIGRLVNEGLLVKSRVPGPGLMSPDIISIPIIPDTGADHQATPPDTAK